MIAAAEQDEVAHPLAMALGNWACPCGMTASHWAPATAGRVIAQSPPLADAIARDTTESTDELAAEIAGVIRSQE